MEGSYEMITKVKIDHDIPFTSYSQQFILSWRKKIPYEVTEMFIRRSCGGNTHICVCVNGNLSPLDELLIRAIMHDDSRRIRGDLERYALNSPLFGLLFDVKYNSNYCVPTYAGEWCKVW